MTLDKLARYMGEAERYLRAERSIWAARETLERLVDTKDVPATVELWAAREGLPIMYHEMTPEDCLRWAEVAKTWPDKRGDEEPRVSA